MGIPSAVFSVCPLESPFRHFLLRHTRLDIAAVISRQSLRYRSTPKAPEPHFRTAVDACQPRVKTQDSTNDQLCVPLLVLKGDSYRLKDRDLGRVPADDNP